MSDVETLRKKVAVVKWDGDPAYEVGEGVQIEDNEWSVGWRPLAIQELERLEQTRVDRGIWPLYDD